MNLLYSNNLTLFVRKPTNCNTCSQINPLSYNSSFKLHENIWLYYLFNNPYAHSKYSHHFIIHSRLIEINFKYFINKISIMHFFLIRYKKYMS